MFFYNYKSFTYNKNFYRKLKTISKTLKNSCLLISGSMAHDKLTPNSDIDVLILHSDDLFDEEEVKKVFYALNALEKKVVLSTRNFSESIKLLNDTKTFFYYLGSKFIGGRKDIYDNFFKKFNILSKNFLEKHLRVLSLNCFENIKEAILLSDLKECPGGFRETSLALDILKFKGKTSYKLKKNFEFLYKIRFLLNDNYKTNKLNESFINELLKKDKNIFIKLHRVLRENAVYYRILIKGDYLKVKNLIDYIYLENAFYLKDLFCYENIFSLIPAYKKIKALPQQNIHNYTVDHHQLLALQELKNIEHSFFLNIYNELEQNEKEILQITLLLHDLGKYRKGHVEISLIEAKKVLRKVPISKNSKNLILHLIEHHHLIYHTITKEDLEDANVIKKLSQVMDGLNTVKSFLIFTYCDLMATNKKAVNEWLLELLRHFYIKMDNFYKNFSLDITSIKDWFIQSNINLEDEKLKIISSFPIKFIENSSFIEIDTMSTLLLKSLELKKSVANIEYVEDSSAILYISYHMDRVGIIHALSKVLSSHGISIIYASVNTTNDGLVFDKFKVRGYFLNRHRNRELLQNKIEELLNEAEIKIEFDSMVFKDASINIFNENSHTVFELVCNDADNIIKNITGIMASLGINIIFAKVSTFGKRVTDIFHICDSNGKALSDHRIKSLKDKLV